MLSWWTHALAHLSTPTESTPARASPDGSQSLGDDGPALPHRLWQMCRPGGGRENLGEAGNSLYLPLRFDVNPKLLFKKKKSLESFHGRFVYHFCSGTWTWEFIKFKKCSPPSPVVSWTLVPMKTSNQQSGALILQVYRLSAEIEAWVLKLSP